MVGKMQDSKNSTSARVATPPLPLSPSAQQMKTMIIDMKSQRINRGLTNFIPSAAANRPMAKSPCAIASRLDPVAWVVPEVDISVS